MRGGPITSEEKSAISTYVGAGIAVLLGVIGIYFFFLTQKEKRKPQLSIEPAHPQRRRFEKPAKGRGIWHRARQRLANTFSK